MMTKSSSMTFMAVLGLLAQEVVASPLASLAHRDALIGRDNADDDKYWPTVHLFTQEKNNHAQPHNFDNQTKEAEKGWWGNEKDDSRWFRFDGDKSYSAETFYLGYFASATKKDDMPETMTGDNERIAWQRTANPWITGTPTLEVEADPGQSSILLSLSAIYPNSGLLSLDHDPRAMCSDATIWHGHILQSTVNAKSTTRGKPVQTESVATYTPNDSMTFLETYTYLDYPATAPVEVKLKPDNLPTGSSTIKTGAVEVHCTSVENKPFPK
ncbi:hypothetical protein I316_05591 [Kwoniella heveanensis BCC8398]|uniref:Uncharacterized protein n=1 Tax=Kwoniella heveanensis BCC8398 TaxID=1296120 RepID=A0A1B9GNN7_9TREE|nr:hypothetical protein I316_05591 [Kwoniella heveanensis BCC8398]